VGALVVFIKDRRNVGISSGVEVKTAVDRALKNSFGLP